MNVEPLTAVRYENRMVGLELEPITVHPKRSFLPLGATVRADGVVFRIWAPKHSTARVVIGEGSDARVRELVPEPEPYRGYFSAFDPDARAGDVYFIELSGERVPDPASRF